MERKFRNARGELITIEDIFEGYFIADKNGEERSIRDSLPRKCDECGFPAMEIQKRDFKRQIVILKCFWCNSIKELCLICGEIGFHLESHYH